MMLISTAAVQTGCQVTIPEWKKAQERVKKTFRAFEANRKDFWFGEYPDTYQAQGNLIKEQPSDMWCLYSGNFFTVEIKSCHQQRFPFKDIRTGQLKAALRVTAAGGQSIFLIAKLPEWQWYKADGMALLQLKRDGEASVKWDDLAKINLSISEVFDV